MVISYPAGHVGPATRAVQAGALATDAAERIPTPNREEAARLRRKG